MESVSRLLNTEQLGRHINPCVTTELESISEADFLFEGMATPAKSIAQSTAKSEQKERLARDFDESSPRKLKVEPHPFSKTSSTFAATLKCSA